MNILLYNYLIFNLIKYRFIVNINILLIWLVGLLEIFRKIYICFFWLYKVYIILVLWILWIFFCNLKKYIDMIFKFYNDSSKCYFIVFKIYICFINCI